MHIIEVIATLTRAKERHAYGYVEVTIPGQNATEFIVNHPDSLDNKIEYYKRTYDSDCVHKNCPDIRIVNVGAMLEFPVKIQEM